MALVCVPVIVVRSRGPRTPVARTVIAITGAVRSRSRSRVHEGRYEAPSLPRRRQPVRRLGRRALQVVDVDDLAGLARREAAALGRRAGTRDGRTGANVLEDLLPGLDGRCHRGDDCEREDVKGRGGRVGDDWGAFGRPAGGGESSPYEKREESWSEHCEANVN